MQRKQNNFGVKIWEQKGYNKNAEWINNMEKELQELEEGHEADIH